MHNISSRETHIGKKAKGEGSKKYRNPPESAQYETKLPHAFANEHGIFDHYTISSITFPLASSGTNHLGTKEDDMLD
jgi:hypothetical protein